MQRLKSKWKPRPATNMYSHCSVLTENPLFNFPVCVVSIILLFDTQSKCHRKKPQECHVLAFYFTFIRNNVYAAVFNLIKVLDNKFEIYISSNDRKWVKKKLILPTLLILNNDITNKLIKINVNFLTMI